MNSSLPSYIKCTMCSGLTVCCLRCCLIALLHGSVTWFSVWASLETAHGPASDSAPTYSVGRRLALKGVLGCNLPFLYCFCVGFTLGVNNTRVADRLYLYGQESCSLSSRPSATLYLRRLVRRTCCDDSGPVCSSTATGSCLSRRDTWLILPVVICLSQRLSHARPCSCLIKVKPRMAH